MCPPRQLISAMLFALSLIGCASRPVNERLDAVAPQAGYRVGTRPLQADNDPATLLILAFSGGGTRAAAFSYGVLEELRRTAIKGPRGARRLLDEVDFITGVSGGSFTALSYALYGEKLFSEFEQRFLKRDVQGELIRHALNPLNWFDLASDEFGRSELAANHYDDILFGGATFADLRSMATPTAIVTATDITTGSRFTFTQDDFDLICSQLGKVRLARAAAASSAVPLLLSPVTFNNYGGGCAYEEPEWVRSVVEPHNKHRPAGRALQRYREMKSFQDRTNRPYIHLVDGAVSDNLGLRGILENLEEIEASKEYRKEQGVQFLKRIAVIIVNSLSTPDTGWDRSSSPPGGMALLSKAAGVPIDRYSYEQIELLKDIVARWNLLRETYINKKRLLDPAFSADGVPRVEFYPIDITFESIPDESERSYFMNLPTSLALPSGDVDRLRDVARRLLRQSPPYRRLVEDLGGFVPD
ncbi:MAG: patatin-like phospholipase family protein [Betaproteobacteria bacterium]|nr:patatin-like phospholipase family protein [Betaproteobacteria bacterium]